MKINPFSLHRDMLHFNIFALQQSILTVETIEHKFPKDPPLYLYILVGLFCFLILTTNGYLLFFVFKQSSRSFLDWLMVLDSILCLGNCMTLIGNFKRTSYTFLTSINQ